MTVISKTLSTVQWVALKQQWCPNHLSLSVSYILPIQYDVAHSSSTDVCDVVQFTIHKRYFYCSLHISILPEEGDVIKGSFSH